MIHIEAPSLFSPRWRVWIEDRFGSETQTMYCATRAEALDQAHDWRVELHERGLVIHEPADA